MTRPDRVPARRYYDREFYEMECELLWPRVWQMACRLEEIPNPGDFVVYENLDQSIIVVRVDASTVKAYHNACRHRGVQLVEDRGSCSGFICPFHGWCFGLDGANSYMLSPELFDQGNLDATDVSLRPCRIELWGGSAFVNLDDDAPALRDSIEPFASIHDAHHVEQMRTEWWYAARLPVNWKLAIEAFMEGYHVMETHPQLVPPGVKGSNAAYVPVVGTTTREPMPGPIDSRAFIDTNVHFMRVLSEGMAGMTHQKDVRVAEGLRGLELPADPELAYGEWNRKLNDAVVSWNRSAGMDIAELNDLLAQGLTFPAAVPVNYCFPHYFLLPMYGNASSYRIRPLGPEETLFEIWSLTLFPDGEEPPPPETPERWECDDPRWPPIPAQDFSNLPRQQKGLHTNGFEYMRLSDQVEGLIGNYQRLIDGYLAGLGHEQLLPALAKVNGMIDQPVKDLGF
jgi:phenylpropionate dioxygenase-like ring-hydroxylating dioxygenase large terminal subunit